MMKTYKKWFMLGLLLLVLVGVSTAVSAEINGTGSYTISKSVVAGGGHQSITNGSYSLAGTVGQTAVNPATTSGDYTLASGFWTSAQVGNSGYNIIYLPMVIKP